MSRDVEKKALIRRLEESIDFYYTAERYKQCEKLCLEVLALEPLNSWTRHILALVYTETDRYEEAIEIGHSIVENGDLFQGYYVLATAYEDGGRPAEALEYYPKALEICTDSANIWCSMLRAYTNLGEAEKCKELIAEMLSRFPVEPQVLYTCFRSVHDLEPDTVWENELFVRLQPVLATVPKRLHYLAGLLAKKEGRIADAYHYFCQAYLENMEDRKMRERIAKLEEEYPELKN